jgi:hypothetical protein
MVKPLGRWRSTDQFGASDFIGATPRALASLRGIDEAPPAKKKPQHIHVYLPGPTRTADAAPRRRTRDQDPPDLNEGRASPGRSGGLPPASFSRRQTIAGEPGEEFADQDPIGARLQPGDQFTVGEDCDEGGFSLKRSSTGDQVFGQTEPSPAAKALGDAALRLDRPNDLGHVAGLRELQRRNDAFWRSRR